MDVAAVETIEAGASEVAEDTSFDPDKRIDVEQNQDTDNTSSEYDVDKRIEVTDTSMDSENYDPDKRIDVSENNDKHQAEENEYNPDDRVTFDTFKDSILSEKMGDIYVPEQRNEQIDSENTTFDVDKRIDVNQNEVTDDSSEYDPDKRIEVSEIDSEIKTDITEKNDMEIKAERTGLIPRNGGEWTGIPGDSEWKPNPDVEPGDRHGTNPEHKTWGEIMEEYNFESVPFHNNEPDFSELSKGTVEIDDFSEERDANFNQADEKLAEQRGCTPEEVDKWRAENKYTWHECKDCKTMQKVPTKVHGNISHSGGISEQKSQNKNS